MWSKLCDNTSGFCTACFDGKYPCEPPSNPGKFRFETAATGGGWRNEEPSVPKATRAAGVDITAGYRAVELMKQHVARTMTPGVLEGFGGFGGLFELDHDRHDPPRARERHGRRGHQAEDRVSELDKHDTVGIDCVAMCVNDIVCCGAKPLIFLDYIACGQNVPETDCGHRFRRG